MNSSLRWGILGTGRIAGIFAGGVAESRTGTLVAVGSRAKHTAKAFAERHGCCRAHPSYETLLEDSDVEAVYISTPHPMHAEWAIKAAEAGKHILCEKPLALNHPEAMAMIEAARRADVFLMEAFLYRCHAQTAKIASLVRDKVIGDVRLIRASFGFDVGETNEGRLLENALGGGGILEVGCYAMSMVRMIAGVAAGKKFDDPVSVHGSAWIGNESRVDEYAVASLEFASGVVAEVGSAVRLRMDNDLHIFGADGKIVVSAPWVMNKRKSGPLTIRILRNDEEVDQILIDAGAGLFALGADHVAEHITARQSPVMEWEDSLGNMKALDRWRESVSFVYDGELPDRQLQTVHRRPLVRTEAHQMSYGEIPGVRPPVSRLIMGVDSQHTVTQGSVMFDDFFEQGGNAFDTAFVYGNGKCESVLGHWIHNRGVRNDVIVIGKGAHPPYCTPGALSTQLLISLSRLRTDFLDVYLLHRDNPEVPVGEFVDVVNMHMAAGQIRAAGVSNWSIERFDAANEYAKSKGLQGFRILSNNFSLARMVDPVWAGCVSASDPKWRIWLKERDLILLSWSSQARGFFTDRVQPDDHSDPQLVRCWYAEDNFHRRERAIVLAEKKGVLPINIALAYVLKQPFRTFCLIGPHTLEETATSLPGLHVELSSEELRWLNLED